MHIVFLTIDFSIRTSGGIGTYIDTMANGLTELGHTVSVLVPSGMGRAVSAYQVIELPPISRGYQTRRIDLSDAFNEVLNKVNLENSIDVVEATDYGMEGLAVMRAGRLPLVVRLHTPDSLVNQLNDETRLLDADAVADAEGAYFAGARYLSAPSSAMTAYMKLRWAVDEFRVQKIPNPVVTPPLTAATGQIREAKRLVFFGRLERRKGVFVIADALRRVMSEDCDLEFEFIGANTRTASGSVVSYLNKQLSPFSDRVRFSGHLSGKDKYHRLLACGCVVLPSLWENFPYACLEAMACGKPVLATTGCGFDEMIQDGLNGRLIPPGNVETLTSEILTITNERFPLLETVNQEYLQSLAPERLLPKFVAYYQQVVESWT